MKNKVDTSSFRYRLGQNIARLRKEQGLSQEDMELYGISRSYYGKIELGLFNVSLDKLSKISYALGVRIIDLFIDENGRVIEP